MADGGWENALSTKLLATHCVFCGRPLRDPQSVERGWGPECGEKFWMPESLPTALNVEAARTAMRMAPDKLRARWAEVGGGADDADADWLSEPDTRRKMLSIGLEYGAYAVSFGADAVSTVAAKVDSAKQCIAAVQHFAAACGYDKCSQRLKDKYVERLQGNLILFRKSKKPGFLGVHVPFSQQWLDWCRGNRQYFEASQKEGQFFFRFFDEKKLGFIANALVGCFGDTLAIDADGNMVPLPSMAIEPEKPAPAMDITAENVKVTNEVREYAVPDKVKLGDLVKTPDGRELQVMYIDPRREFVGVGKKAHGKGYEMFLSFAQVKEISGREIAKELYNEVVRYAEETKQEVPPPPTAQATARSIPVLKDGQSLDPHQVSGVQFIDEHRGRTILADEMGLGKTITGIVSLDVPAVVVCPSNLKVNWNREIMKWKPGVSVAMIEGGSDPGEIAKKADVVIINYDILDKHIEWMKKRGNITVLADEAHYLKNMEPRWDKKDRIFKDESGVKRAAAFYELQRGVPRLLLLTGTPIMNRTRELFPLLHMLDTQAWGSGYNFCIQYCGGHEEFIGRRKIFKCDGRTNSEELFNKVNNKYMLRRTVSVLNLPEKRYEPRTVSMDEASKAKYTRQVQEFLAWVEENGGPEAVMRAMRAEVLVQMNKLRETCAEGKAEAAVDFIKQHWISTARPLVVMATHKSAFKRMQEGVDALNAEYAAQRRAGDEPDMQAPIRYASVVGGMGSEKVTSVVDQFQRGDLDVVFYSISLAVGTTLTRGQDMLFVERAWRPADLAQAEARIFRRGQKNQCCFTYMDAAGTIDDKIAMLLKEKAGTIAAIIHGVNLDDEDAAALVLGEMFSIPEGGARGVRRNPGDIVDEIADSWFSPL